jgi:hypothetical protein
MNHSYCPFLKGLKNALFWGFFFRIITNLVYMVMQSLETMGAMITKLMFSELVTYLKAALRS